VDEILSADPNLHGVGRVAEAVGPPGFPFKAPHGERLTGDFPARRAVSPVSIRSSEIPLLGYGDGAVHVDAGVLEGRRADLFQDGGQLDVDGIVR